MFGDRACEALYAARVRGLIPFWCIFYPQLALWATVIAARYAGCMMLNDR